MSTREQKERRNKVLRIGAGTLAFLGIGAAITTAAWTDNVWFSADADAASFNLQGSLEQGGPWTENDSEEGALAIPIEMSQFGDLLPSNEPVTTTVYVKNDSSVPVTLEATGTASGALFEGEGATTEITASAPADDVAAGSVTPITITLIPGDIPKTLAGATGTYVLHVSGTVGD